MASKRTAKHSFFPPPKLNYSDPEWSQQERYETLRWYIETHGPGDGRLVPFVPFLMEHDPAGFKRYRHHSTTFAQAGTTRYAYAPCFIVSYTAIGYGQGVLYEIIATRGRGLTKRQVQELISFAYILGGPLGINATAEWCGPYLAGWEDDGQPSTHEWPEGWKVDPQLLRSGMDLDSPGMSATDVEAVEAWHRRVGGEVPRHVRLWSELNPVSFKTQRARFETALGETVPAQVFPLSVLHFAAVRMQPTMARRALLQARALGVARRDAVQVLEAAFIYGGEWQMEAVLTDEVLEVLRGMKG
ncbi:MAG: hypothetical protein KGJ98_00550 [Chloroflexota bacterium]|nr:hypothetical protein [Chloroflexota bacterium]